MAYLTAIHTAETRLADHFSTFVAQYRAASKRRKAFNQTRDELSALSSRELADLGISRSMITSVAREAANGVK